MRLSIPLSQLLRRVLLSCLGLMVFAFGNLLTVKANIGQAAWNVLYMGLSKVLPITYGQIIILISVIVILLDILMKEPIGLGSILDVFLVGIFYDFFEALHIIPIIQNPLVGFLVLMVGMVLMAVAQKMHMSSCLGCGPRDTMMVGIGKRMRKVPIGVVSMLIALTVMLAGWLLGGDVGLGTVFYLLCNGLVMQLVFNVLHFEPRNLQHLNLLQMFCRKEK